MNVRLLGIAGRIIGNSSRDRPADSVLRFELKNCPGLSREESAQISRAVFSYFRWFGWLDQNQAPTDQIKQANELAVDFSLRPACFSDADVVQRAVPTWVKEAVSVTPEWARAIQAEPRLWVRARKGQGAALAAQLGEAKVHGSTMVDTLEYLGSNDLFRSPEYQSGAFELQDISSQAVSLICSPLAGETWWDACAGEGGKLLHLSDLMNNRGLIWATDRAIWRLKTLKRRAARARAHNFRVRQWDGGARLPMRTLFDGVLLDAPCTGIGTWQRNPHARWTTTATDVRELSLLQKILLAHAATAVKPGGKLVYTVCTLSRAETAEVVADFERRFPEFKPLEVTNPLRPGLARSPVLLLTTEETRGNGMFVAAWRRGNKKSRNSEEFRDR